MQNKKNWGSKLVGAGVDSCADQFQARTTRFINLFSIITIIGLCVGFTNIIFLKDNYPLLPEAAAFVISCLTIFLNYKKQYDFATYLYLICLNTVIFFVNEYYHISTASYLFYFPLILCVALLHNPVKGIFNTVLYFTITLLFIVTSVLIDFDVFSNHEISVENNRILFYYNLIFSVVISVILVVLVIGVIDRQNFQLIRSLTKERSNQERISNSLKEKEIMLSEIHHRVKNNLAIITSLLNLQLNATTNEEAKKLLIDSRNRVLSMSMAHHRLYDSKNLSKIDFASYLEELINELIDASPLKNRITIQANCIKSEVELTKAVPVGLIVNEIITNSIKHAFPIEGKEPKIKLAIEKKSNNLIVDISDNGVGFERSGFSNDKSLGLSLIDSLVEQIDGKLIFENLDGARYKLMVPCQ